MVIAFQINSKKSYSVIIKNLSSTALIIFFLITSINSCAPNPPVKNNSSKSELKYDGYVEQNSLSPKHFKGKYFLDLRVHISSSDEILVKGEIKNLETLSNSLKENWEIIEKDGYKAFLNIVVGNSKNVDYGFFLKVKKLIENFRTDTIEEYSMKKFGIEYLSLDRKNQTEINQTILINIVESEPEIVH